MSQWYEELSKDEQAKMNKWLWILHPNREGQPANWVNAVYVLGIFFAPAVFYLLLGIAGEIDYGLFHWDILGNVAAFLASMVVVVPSMLLMRLYIYEKRDGKLRPKHSIKKEFTVKSIFIFILTYACVPISTYMLFALSKQSYWEQTSPELWHHLVMALTQTLITLPSTFHLIAKTQYVILFRKSALAQASQS